MSLMINFGVLLPSGRELIYFVPQIDRGEPTPLPDGDEDVAGSVIDPNAAVKAYVQLNPRSPRWRDEDSDCGGRHYFKTSAQAHQFLDERERGIEPFVKMTPSLEKKAKLL